MDRRTEIVVLLDRSGSMQTGRSDHEGGLNSFVTDQKTEPGDARFTFIQFDSNNPCEIIYDGAPLTEVGTLSLVPRGGTPLYRAILQAGAHVKTRLDKDDGEKQVIFMIITDGQDTEYGGGEVTVHTARAFIEDREKEGWTFLYLGANVDSFAEAGALGINPGVTMDVATAGLGTQCAYASSSANMVQSRQAFRDGATPDVASRLLSYSPDQRTEALVNTTDTALAGKLPEDQKKKGK